MRVIVKEAVILRVKTVVRVIARKAAKALVIPVAKVLSSVVRQIVVVIKADTAAAVGIVVVAVQHQHALVVQQLAELHAQALVQVIALVRVARNVQTIV